MWNTYTASVKVTAFATAVAVDQYLDKTHKHWKTSVLVMVRGVSWLSTPEKDGAP